MRRTIVGILLGLVVAGLLAVLGWDLNDLRLKRAREQAAERKQLQLQAWQAAFDSAQALNQKGSYVEAESALQAMLPETEQQFPGQTQLFDTVDMIGRVEIAQRAYEDAEPLLLRALALAQGLPDANKTAVALEDLVMLYQKSDRMTEQESYLHRAIDLFEKNPAKYGGDLAISYDQLARTEYLKGHKEAAASLLKKAINKYPAYPGPRHAYMVTAYADLGQDETELQKYTEAEQALDEATKMGVHYMEADDPAMAAVWTRVGTLALKEQKYSAAEHFLRQAYDLVNRPVTAQDIDQEQEVGGNLVDLYEEIGRNAEGEAILKQSLADSTRLLGQNDGETYDAVLDLGKFYEHVGKYPQAEARVQEAERGREALLGPENVATATALSELALVYFFERKSAMGEQAAMRSLPIMKKAYGENSLPVSTTLNRLGLCQRDEHKYDEAIASLEQALAIRETFLPPNHSWVVLSEENLASAFLAAGQREDALRLQLKARGVRLPERSIAVLN